MWGYEDVGPELSVERNTDGTYTMRMPCGCEGLYGEDRVLVAAWECPGHTKP